MIKKKKLIVSLATAALLAAVAIGGTLAYFTDKDSRSNVITLGKVQGTLTESNEKSRGDGTTGKDYSNIKPGQTLEKDPTVTIASDSENAFARIKINYSGLTDVQAAELEAGITLNAGWVKGDDGYYYYKDEMNKNETATLFNQVVVPTTWGNEVANLTFVMNVSAELIQSDYFTPTKDANGNITGWGNVNIENYQATTAAN